ncbi:hypothetical protein ILUMI_02518 [Ignelater luminosus]|uniref:F-box domain-containing protein n=1 Tax=Ignelater luminosus TaxID=2038154 RepID=A0A8K0GKR9_IGNLU|nr:hypothetical protein ILUMI_02518 [Ignelater luminosus]
MALLNHECVGKIFTYLSNEDLVNCSLVNSFWKRIALKTITIRTTKKEYIELYNFLSLVSIAVFDTGRIIYLDLSEAALLHDVTMPIWSSFSFCVRYLQQLKYLIIRFCPASIIESLSSSNPSLQKITFIDTKGPSMNLVSLKNFEHLKELFLQFTHTTPVVFKVGNDFHNLNNLLELTITGVFNISISRILQVINFQSLQSLSLGSCVEFPLEYATILRGFQQLKKLRLEGCKSLTALAVFYAVAGMDNLKHLEMIDVEIPNGTDEGIARCTNLSKLLIAPNHKNVTNTNNRRILCGVLKLRKNLQHFQWIFAQRSFSDSWKDIIISKELPYLDEYGNIETLYVVKGKSVKFDTASLKTFIELFMPDCIISIKKIPSASLFSSKLSY